jgi:hypothetical protein
MGFNYKTWANSWANSWLNSWGVGVPVPPDDGGGGGSSASSAASRKPEKLVEVLDRQPFEEPKAPDDSKKTVEKVYVQDTFSLQEALEESNSINAQLEALELQLRIGQLEKAQYEENLAFLTRQKEEIECLILASEIDARIFALIM